MLRHEGKMSGATGLCQFGQSANLELCASIQVQSLKAL